MPRDKLLLFWQVGQTTETDSLPGAPCLSHQCADPASAHLLSWTFVPSQDKELTEAYDSKTLLDLNLHTGFSLSVSAAPRSPVRSSLIRSDASPCPLPCPQRMCPTARRNSSLAGRAHPSHSHPCAIPYPRQGYDLTEEPDYWPPVVETPEGRRIVSGAEALKA